MNPYRILISATISAVTAALFLCALALGYMGFEYHFGSGYGLIGVVSFPAAIGLACLAGSGCTLLMNYLEQGLE